MIKPQSSNDLMNGQPLREMILIAGKDGVGKSSAIVSLAWYIEQISPKAKFFVIDTENKFKSALRSFGSDAPKNIQYYKTDTMNQVTEVVPEILKQHAPGDWLAVESMSRVWERAQDMGFQAVAGTGKAEWFEKRKAEGKKGGLPQPDQLWSLVKGAHDGAFLDLLISCDTLNVILSTIVARPPKPDAFIKESVDRKTARIELGIDVGLEGAPRLPYYVESLCLFDMKAGRVSCRILRDNLSALEDSRIEFEVPDKRSWAITFWSQCR